VTRWWRRLVWAAWWLQYATSRLELGARRLLAGALDTTEPGPIEDPQGRPPTEPVLPALPGRCREHALTHCWDCGYITAAEAADLFARVSRKPIMLHFDPPQPVVRVVSAPCRRCGR
jgi:hypothetical protein